MFDVCLMLFVFCSMSGCVALPAAFGVLLPEEEDLLLPEEDDLPLPGEGPPLAEEENSSLAQEEHVFFQHNKYSPCARRKMLFFFYK